jgi:5-formyltetrahydrofolate cyclo-ligase
MLKSTLRKLYKEKRAGVSPALFKQGNEDIIFRLLTDFNWTDIQYFHTFLPIAKQQEIDTYPLIHRLKDTYPHLNIVIPCTEWQTNTLKHVLWHPNLPLKENQRGIPEPLLDSSSIYVNPQTIDRVLIPLLAYDLQGNRVGYGKGFYDRFLAACRPAVEKIGVSLFDPICAIEDASVLDIKLNYCVTPQKVWRF